MPTFLIRSHVSTVLPHDLLTSTKGHGVHSSCPQHDSKGQNVITGYSNSDASYSHLGDLRHKKGVALLHIPQHDKVPYRDIAVYGNLYCCGYFIHHTTHLGHVGERLIEARDILLLDTSANDVPYNKKHMLGSPVRDVIY